MYENVFKKIQYIRCPKSFQLNVYNIKKLKAPLYNEQIQLQLSHVRAGIVQSQCTRNAFLYHCAHILDIIEIKYKSSLFIIWALAYHGILNIGPVRNSYQQIQTLSVWLAFTAWNIWVRRNIICHQSLKSIWLKLLQQIITNRLCLHNTIFLTNDPNQSWFSYCNRMSNLELMKQIHVQKAYKGLLKHSIIKMYYLIKWYGFSWHVCMLICSIHMHTTKCSNY